MTKFDNQLYWEVAKFAFSLIGGGAAGYYAVKAVNSVVTKGTSVSVMFAAPKMMKMVGKKEDEKEMTV